MEALKFTLIKSQAQYDRYCNVLEDLVDILGLSKGTVSKILNYHKGLSKETIRKLANFFKVSKETFNRPYKLKNEESGSFHAV